MHLVDYMYIPFYILYNFCLDYRHAVDEMDTPVTRYVSILKNPKKNLFQSPVDSVKENYLPVFSTPLVRIMLKAMLS